MKLLVYTDGNNVTRERLHNIIVGQVPERNIEVCETVANLSHRLRQRTGDLGIVILCVSTPEELAEILALSRWLHDLKTILLLPDRNSTTLAKGLTLRPRFLGYADSDFSDVSAVLRRMLAIYANESRWSS
jgi:hypothetical protein